MPGALQKRNIREKKRSEFFHITLKLVWVCVCALKYMFMCTRAWAISLYTYIACFVHMCVRSSDIVSVRFACLLCHNARPRFDDCVLVPNSRWSTAPIAERRSRLYTWTFCSRRASLCLWKLTETSRRVPYNINVYIYSERSARSFCWCKEIKNGARTKFNSYQTRNRD